MDWSAWYLDDGNIAGSLEALSRCVEITQKEGPQLGLHLNREKCTFTGSGHTPDALQQLRLGDLRWVHEDGEGAATVLGSPIGAAGYILNIVGKVVDKLHVFHRALAKLEDPQVELYLARGSLSVCRVTHLLRVVSKELMREKLTSLDALFRNTLNRIVGAPLTDET